MNVGQRPSIVDNIFTNISEKNLTMAIWLVKNRPTTQFLTHYRLNCSAEKTKHLNQNMKALTQKTYLKDLDLLESLYYINFANVNEPYNEFHGELIAVIDKNTPDKTLIKGEQKQNKKTIDYQKFQKSIKTKRIY